MRQLLEEITATHYQQHRGMVIESTVKILVSNDVDAHDHLVAFAMLWERLGVWVMPSIHSSPDNLYFELVTNCYVISISSTPYFIKPRRSLAPGEPF